MLFGLELKLLEKKSLFEKQETPSAAGPSRLKVTSGFSWDVGLSSLEPAHAAQDEDSSEGEDQEGSSKVRSLHLCVEKVF